MLARLPIRLTLPILMTVPVILVVVLLSFLVGEFGQRAADQLGRQSLAPVHRQIATRLGLLVEETEAVLVLTAGWIRRGQLNPRELAHWRLPLYEQTQAFPTISSISFARPDGAAVWVAHYAYEGKVRFALKSSEAKEVVNTSLGTEGQLLADVHTYRYDPQARPWYQRGLQADRPTWSPPFVWVRPEAPQAYLGTGLVWGLRDTAGELLGVLDVEITLDDLSTFLESLTIGDHGFALILDSDGTLVASSLASAAFGQQSEPPKATEALHPVLASAARELPSVFSQEQFHRWTYQGRPFLSMASRYLHPSGLDWRVVTVVPESDFTGTLEQTRRRLWWIGFLTVAGTVIVGFLLGFSIARPIAQLSRTAVLREDDPKLRRRGDEIGELARAFHEAQQDLLRSERYFRSLIENATDMTLVVGEGGEIFYASPSVAKLFDDSPGHLRDLIDPEALADLLASPDHASFEMAWGDRWVEVMACRPGDDSVTGIVLNAADITARRRSEELEQEKQAAVAAGRAQAAFLANMSHELRTPMNSVIGFADFLSRRLGDQLGQREQDALQTIETNARHLLDLINEILELSRLESGKMPLTRESLELEALVEEVTRVLTPQAEKNGNLLQVVLEPVTIESDRTKLRQILYNLIGNACKFTRNGQITVRLQAGAEGVTLSVSDTGIGISSAQMEGLFQPFAQADPSISQRYGGSGLGLAISQQYARLLGGEIEVVSTLGAGSTFSLILPK